MQRKEKLQEIRQLASSAQFIEGIIDLLNPAELLMLRDAIYRKFGAKQHITIDLGSGIKPDET